MTPCQGADFRHFLSDTSAVGIWWGLFVFRTIRIWNTNCSCVDASNASPPLCTPSPPPPPPAYPLGKYLLHISTQKQREQLLFFSADESVPVHVWYIKTYNMIHQFPHKSAHVLWAKTVKSQRYDSANKNRKIVSYRPVLLLVIWPRLAHAEQLSQSFCFLLRRPSNV